MIFGTISVYEVESLIQLETNCVAIHQGPGKDRRIIRAIIDIKTQQASEGCTVNSEISSEQVDVTKALNQSLDITTKDVNRSLGFVIPGGTGGKGNSSASTDESSAVDSGYTTIDVKFSEGATVNSDVGILVEGGGVGEVADIQIGTECSTVNRDTIEDIGVVSKRSTVDDAPSGSRVEISEVAEVTTVDSSWSKELNSTTESTAGNDSVVCGTGFDIDAGTECSATDVNTTKEINCVSKRSAGDGDVGVRVKINAVAEISTTDVDSTIKIVAGSTGSKLATANVNGATCKRIKVALDFAAIDVNSAKDIRVATDFTGASSNIQCTIGFNPE